jgi:hypothetical protein
MSNLKLIDLIDNNRTDKNTAHSYIETYQKLFQSKKESAKNVLEIGIGPLPEINGGSIKLWKSYFENSMIVGVDTIDRNIILPEILDADRIILYTETDAYNPEFVQSTFIDNNLKFDILIDDGPHTIESMKEFLKLYSNILADCGIMVIEDVQDINWIPDLINATPNHLKTYIEIYDLRHIKGRWDDILFVINTNKL